MDLIFNGITVFTYTSTMLDGISNQPGTYLLVFYSDQSLSIKVGRLGQFELETGYYFYIGSAFGSGGVRARVGHHYSISSRSHWHLDYIRPSLSLQEVWYSTDAIRYEHDWAAALSRMMQIPLLGLGASDCQCGSHFFYSQTKTERLSIMNSLKKDNTNLNISIVDQL